MSFSTMFCYIEHAVQYRKDKTSKKKNQVIMPTGSFSDNYTRFALSIAVRRFKPYIYVCKSFFFISFSQLIHSFGLWLSSARWIRQKNTHFNAKTAVSIGIKKGSLSRALSQLQPKLLNACCSHTIQMILNNSLGFFHEKGQ